jgi:hypothetical protein
MTPDTSHELTSTAVWVFGRGIPFELGPEHYTASWDELYHRLDVQDALIEMDNAVPSAAHLPQWL